MKQYRLYQVDSFTKEKFRGNPAGVVSNAEGLTVSQMRDIAREMNCSETAFVFPAQDDTHDVWVRYFTPTIEVPICGHATIAAHYVRATEGRLTAPTRVCAKTGAGILPVDTLLEDGDYKIVMTQGNIDFGNVIEGTDRDTLLSALGLSAPELDARCPIQIASTGHSKVMIGINSREKLNSLSPDLGALASLSKRIACNGYYVFTFDTGDENVLTTGRMFAPAIGIAEDPVTGNANGPLGAYLVHHGIVPVEGDTFRFTGAQGEAIGRIGKIDVTVHCQDKEPISVQIGGNAVIVFQTAIQV